MATSDAIASVPDGITIIAGQVGTGELTLAASNNMDAMAEADGAAALGGTAGGTSIGIGVAINVTVLLGALFVGVAVLPFPAISTVSAAYAMAYIAEFIYLAARRPLAAYKE